MQRAIRLVLAFVLAPLSTTIVVGICNAVFFGGATLGFYLTILILAAIATVLFGLPLHAVMRSTGKMSAGAHILAGSLVAIATTAPFVAILPKLLPFGVIAVVSGAVSGFVFWRVAHAGL